jgi:hypothetical protein
MACDPGRSLRSIESTARASIEFTNLALGARHLFWLNYSGGAQLYAVLQPGQILVQQTFLTHPWMVTDPEGRCVAVYLARQGARRVFLRD